MMLPSIYFPRWIWRETFLVDHIASYTVDADGDTAVQTVTQAFTFTGFEFGRWRLGLETALAF